MNNLTESQSSRLAALYNRATLYELVAERGSQRVLIAYSQARSRRGILTACYKYGEALTCMTGTEMLTFAPRAAEGATMGDWRIRFTGRTKRDAIIEGELPHVSGVDPARP